MVVVLLVIALVAGGLAGAVAGRVQRAETLVATPLPTQVAAPAQVGGIADIVEQASPAIAYLTTRVAPIPPADVANPVPPAGVFTGMLVDERGYIVTTASGVGDAPDVTVILADGRQSIGKVLRKSPDNDVAVVKIGEAHGLSVVRTGRSADLRVGEPVLALGSSLIGKEPTASQGLVVGLHRQLSGDGANLDGLIQTDAVIGPARAGGPLLNLAGQVVGLGVPVEAGGASYAIAIDHFWPFVNQVINARRVMSSGVKVATLDPSLSYKLGLTYKPNAVLVTEVRRGSAAETATLQPGGEPAGLRPGDVISEIEGVPGCVGRSCPVETEERFIRLTVTGPYDSPIVLTVLRDRQVLNVRLVLAEVFAN